MGTNATPAVTIAKSEAEYTSAAIALGFTQTPNAVLRNGALSRDARLCYAVLRSYAWDDRYTFVGQDKLAGDLGCSRQQARKYIRELERAGLITVERRGMNRTNLHYHHSNDLKLRLHADGSMLLPPRQTDGNQTLHPVESTVSNGGEAEFPSDGNRSIHDVYPENKDAVVPDALLYQDAEVPLATQAGALAMRNAHSTWSTPQRRHPDQDYFDALGLSDPFSLPRKEQGKYLLLIEDAKKNGLCPATLRQHIEDHRHLVQRQPSGMAEAR